MKNEYGTGGKGFESVGAKYAVWFDDLGLRIAAGDTAKGGTIANASLSWEDVSNRIHELLRQGEYAPQAVLDGQIYYRENSFMNKVELPAVTAERVLGMITLRETTRKLLDCQLHDGSDPHQMKTRWVKKKEGLHGS